MTTSDFGGIPIIESRFVSRDKWFVINAKAGKHILAHPVAILRMAHPKSPVWCERTLGHREMQRDRRKYARS